MPVRGSEYSSGPVTTVPQTFTTKELSKRTWPDYVHFFSQGNGWDHCGCTFAQGFRAPKELRKWSDQRDWNLEVKCGLVEEGRTHGVLVYAGGEPVGWCQFGPANELPLVARGEYIDPRAAGRRRRLFEDGEERLWRVTCFCTRPDYSQQGVTGVALRAALRSIAKRGGGAVEAYPVVLAKGDPDTDERLARVIEWYRTFSRLIKTHGRFSDAMEEHLRNRVEVTEYVEGIGEVDATYHGRGANVGTVNLFGREGFEAVSVVAPKRRSYVHPDRHPTHVVMRKTVPPAR
jgi:hypothetical protein